MPSTTIKVPRELRDRLAVRAQAQQTTLAGAIERALDASDEQRFWDSVIAEHAALTRVERETSRAAGGTDDLADTSDDHLSERGEW